MGLSTLTGIPTFDGAGNATAAVAGTHYQPARIQWTASITPNVGTAGADVIVTRTITAAVVAGAPTGTPVHGQTVTYVLTDDGNGPWGLDFTNAAFHAGNDAILPTTTIDGKCGIYQFFWNSGSSTWNIVTNVGGY
jgi:hypothetical protein